MKMGLDTEHSFYDAAVVLRLVQTHWHSVFFFFHQSDQDLFMGLPEMVSVSVLQFLLSWWIIKSPVNQIMKR